MPCRATGKACTHTGFAAACSERMMRLKYFLIYYAGINLISFVLAALDKQRALNEDWRISEIRLFLTAFLGGSAGLYLSCRLFHHKTRQKRFMLGLPLIFAAQLLLFLLVAWRVGLFGG